MLDGRQDTSGPLDCTDGVVILSAALAGCGLFDPGEEDSSTCGSRDWCVMDSDGGYTDGAYSPTIAGLYCQVSQVRERLRAGELEAADLPGWAETEVRDGAPIVVDMATVPAPDFPRRQDDLRAHFEDRGQTLDLEEMRACRDTLTQRDIEATDGKRQAG